MPNLNINTAPYTLRSCLGMEPLARVKSVDDDIQAMWERLDSKYGDPAKVADAIINSIQNVKCIKEGEHKKFIQFVNVIEEGYRDLRNLKLEKEIITTSSISIIEKRLPPDVMKEWARLVSNDTSTIDKTDKFPSLLRFLLNLKRALEYQNAELRLSSEKIKGSVNHTDKKDDNPVEQQRNTKQNRQCLIHENGNHWTSECRVYLSKPIEEKEKIVKERGACWSCLRRGHRSQQCRSKRICNVNNCKRTHHSTLHQEKKEEPSPKQEETPPSVTGTASVCDSTDADTCLLQIQKIRSPKGWVNVLWDNGASLSFITNAKAEAEKLRGTKVTRKEDNGNLGKYQKFTKDQSNAKRGQWKLGKISKVYKGEDGKVRRALVEYKNPKPGEKVTEYKGKGFTTIERPVNKLITILPASEDKWTISKHFGNNNSELLCVILKWFLLKTLNSL